MRVAAALLLLAAPAHAHLTNFCASSDPAAQGVVTFYLGTYHTTNCGGGGSVPGTMHIKMPSGGIQTGSFNDAKCAPSTPQNSATGDVLVQSLVATWGLTPQGAQQCYTSGNGLLRTNADNSQVFDTAVQGGSEASQGPSCYGQNTINTWYRVSVSGASSGTFEVWTTGTDVNLSPGGLNGNPCMMGPNIHYQMALTIVTGGQACQPFTGSVTGGTVGADCTAPTGGTVAAGVVCNIPCSQVQAGELKCDNGNWVNTYACVASACSSTATSTFTGQTGVAAPCSFSNAPGTSCTPMCTGQDWAAEGAAVVCQSDGTWAGSGACNAASTDVAPTPVIQPAADIVAGSPAHQVCVYWQAPTPGWGGSAVQHYTVTPSAGTCTVSVWPSGTPPADCASGVTCHVPPGDLPVTIDIEACGVNLCAPAASFQLTAPPTCTDGKMNGAETGIDCGGAQCTACLTVSGDPFTSYGGKNTQFYLPLGTEHTLLTCPNVELRGRTKHSGVPGDTQQWFDRFTVLTGPPAGHRNTVTVGLLGSTLTSGSTTSTAAGDRVVAALQQFRGTTQLTVLNLTVDGAAAAGVLPQLTGGWKVETKHMGHAEVVALAAGDVKVRLQSAIANKFATTADNLRHMHIDIEFDGLDAKACAGVFPEIWGVVPMSTSTERLLTP